MNSPKFVLGIGSQRAGTTLLYKILDECTSIFMHPVKELHFFDSLYGVRNPEFLMKFSERQVEREVEKLFVENDHVYIKDERYKCYLRANWILSRQSIREIQYLDLFWPCVANNKIIGEITPEYMIVPERGIKHMSEVVGQDAPIILLSRDPVERFISSFKLLKLYGTDDTTVDNFEFELRRVLLEMPDWVEHQRQLSDFATALTNYGKYFKNICFIKFEDLSQNFSAVADEIEKTLDVPIDRSKAATILKNKINKIGETDSLGPETLEVLRDTFRRETEDLHHIHSLSI